MYPEIPSYLYTNFFILTAALFIALMTGLNKGLERMRHTNMRGVLILTALGVMGWLLFLAVLAGQGYFRKWDVMPPRLLVALVVPVLTMVIVFRIKSFAYLVKEIPESWPVFAQGFRIIVEILLWRLLVEGVIPIQMTFEGWNFDILVGMAAIPVGYFCFVKKTWSKKVAIGFNIGGLILVTTIVVIALLSAPTPFRVFMNDPANTFVTMAPFVWLPGFIVPMAYFLHFISLKQLMTKG